MRVWFMDRFMDRLRFISEGLVYGQIEAYQ